MSHVDTLLTLFAAPTPQQYARSVKRLMMNVMMEIPSRTKVGHRIGERGHKWTGEEGEVGFQVRDLVV